jgi:two-component sensor histidine kinase
MPVLDKSATSSFLSGGGEVGALMRGRDWSRSVLGAPEGWPQSLRSVVGLLLNSKFPMFVAWGPELGFLYNDAYAEILGAKHPAALGARFHDIWAEIWPDISPLIDAAMAGEATYRNDLPLVMNRSGFDEEAWFTFSYSPVRDEGGQVAGMFCAVAETTERVLSERRQATETLERARVAEHLKLLVLELNHRVKNNLATMQAIAIQTLRATENPADAKEAFLRRITALASAHDILTREQWEGASLDEVAQGVLLALSERREAVRIAGPEVRLDPRTALSLSMAFHELGTNALKYGALSRPDGHVELRWTADPPGGSLRLIWTEHGGPPVTPPSRRGFGSRLLERGLAGELDGEVELRFEPGGVVCLIRMPRPGS